ncbi:MAG: GNAT family N-acetyltransferase [Opitutaceae bacterium]|nr:GNAT family N-acetyltransferase [Opitutaceae bacterium]
MEIKYHSKDTLDEKEVIELYESNGWSSAKKPTLLLKALKGSHSLITARDASRLVGLGNAISDGYLVVYYPHLLVHPDYQHKGIGKEIMKRLQSGYADFHQQMLAADGEALGFYKKLGFKRAGRTQSMWIYDGDDH